MEINVDEAIKRGNVPAENRPDYPAVEIIADYRSKSGDSKSGPHKSAAFY